jgi:CMP-N-acetylneuraminic acid synthetase
MAGQYDAFITLQPTSPLRTAVHIDESINLFERHPDADCLVSVVVVPHNMIPEALMVVDHQGYLADYVQQRERPLRRQDKARYFARNGAAIYITRSNRIQDFIFGGKILAYAMDKISSIDIDDEDDWRLLELIINGNH